MAIDPRYIPATYLQQYLVDKDSGLPLAGGEIESFKDQARTEKIPFYEISGVAPNYTYTPLPNPIILSSVGTAQNGSSDDVIPYFFPYDANGDTQLYYYTVKSSLGVQQFTREGQPNVSAGAVSEGEEINYISNGQFRIHTDIPPTSTTDADVVSEDITFLSQGGITYERSAASTAKDLITFERFATAVTNPAGNPRYACRIECEAPSAGDGFKELRFKFRDVNKFTSPEGNYTFSFAVKTNAGTTGDVTVTRIKNYGTGGDPEEKITVKTLTISSTYVVYNVIIDFEDNIGKTLGDDDDDFVQVGIGFLANSLFDISLTDVSLLFGETEVQAFPITPEYQFLRDAIAGWLTVPAHDGSDLYLNTRLTQEGLEYDHSVIGNILDRSIVNVPDNVLLCNGGMYKTDDYSSLGIPYSRLQIVLAADALTLNLPAYGTGRNFVTSRWQTSYPTAVMRITENVAGVTTLTTDGTVPTGFAIATVQAGTKTLPYIFNVTTLAATSVTEGAYFRFYNPGYRETVEKKFLVYYTYLASPTAPTETAEEKIKVTLLPADTANDVAEKTWKAMNGLYFATPIRNGLFVRGWDDGEGNDPDAQKYVLEYSIGAAGTGYAVNDILTITTGSATAKIKVLTVGGSGDVTDSKLVNLGTDYATGTHATTGGTGAGCTVTVSKVGGERLPRGDGQIGDYVGTNQDDEYVSHTHPVPNFVGRTGSSEYEKVGGYDGDVHTETNASGGNETRGKNISTNYVIIY